MDRSLPSCADASWTRRQFVRGLGFGMAGLGLGEFLALQSPAEAARTRKKAKACIMLFLFGGPSHIDTWDMKPNAPRECRGEFKSIQTSASDLALCEHLPRTARIAHHLAVVRSVTMSGRVIGNGDHHADTYYMLTGHQPDRSFFVEGINRKPHGDDWPFVGSTAASHSPHLPDLPPVVQLPARSGEITGYINPGQFSGLLGPRFQPVMVRGDLDKPRQLAVPQFMLPADLAGRRFEERRGLVGQIDRWQRQVEQARSFDAYRDKAFALLTSARAKEAFDITREPEAVRARYGNDINCQSVLMARRLVEAGVPFVCVHWIGRKVGAGLSWDTHSDNFGQLKNVLLPAFDACYSALLEDLQARGLLEETLVVVTAEMGRTPKVGDPRTRNAFKPGRDHWIHCQSALFAGGGIRGGQVYGASDRIGAFPAEKPVHPEQIAATIYKAFNISDHLIVKDRLGRPFSLLEEGEPLPLF
jgi:hypothetical protein